MKPTERQLASALRKYNEIMYYLCLEYLTIGTNYSENTANWNLRDMVAECDFQLSTYYENGHANYDMRTENRKQWISETGKLKRFIAHWEPYITEMVCAEGHCSRNYDSWKSGSFFLSSAIWKM